MNIDAVLSRFVSYQGEWALMKRGGHPLLLLPSSRSAARRALDLFQPQRKMARAVIAGIHAATSFGLHHMLMPVVQYHGDKVSMSPELPAIKPGTCGFLFGSSDHRIRRAMACYETDRGWEVAKIAFGDVGREMLEGEAESLQNFSTMTHHAPQCLGLHHSKDATVMRMPYLTGEKIRPGESWDMIALLKDWISNQSPIPIHQFPEWSAIRDALAILPGGDNAMKRLIQNQLVPVIRHGDFTRWNVLKKPSGEIAVIDWEWGHPRGMPGIDFVHYHAQDARLVRNRSPQLVLEETRRKLSAPDVRAYLHKTGWSDDLDALILAAIAYPVGAKHQDNDAVLCEALINYGASGELQPTITR